MLDVFLLMHFTQLLYEYADVSQKGCHMFYGDHEMMSIIL